MAELKNSYANYCRPSNAKLVGNQNSFDFKKTMYLEKQIEMSQDHRKYSKGDFKVGFKNVFGKDDHSQEPVGEVFFSEQNIKRIQKMIREEVYKQTRHQYILEEDQDTADLLIAMRAVYQSDGKFIKDHVVSQVKVLNKKLISYIIPDMITEMKQHYGYIKDINEPLKPIDRPMNVSNAGRRGLPSITTTWM
jgi:hypothetical protein